MAQKLHLSKQLASALYEDDFCNDALNQGVFINIVLCLFSHFSKAEVLLHDGADPNLLLPSEGITPLHYAVGMASGQSLAFTKLLLSFGADPNVRSVEGLTPVHVAATWGRFQALQLLLANGGDPSLKDEDDQTALSLAKSTEKWDCISLLQQLESEAVNDLEEDEDVGEESIIYTRVRDFSEVTSLYQSKTDTSLQDTSLSFVHEDYSAQNLSSHSEVSSNLSSTSEVSKMDESHPHSYLEESYSSILKTDTKNRRKKNNKRVSFFGGLPEEEEVSSDNSSSFRREEENGNLSNGGKQYVLLEGQGLDVTSPDNTIIFHKRASRDKRKTGIFSLLHSPYLSPTETSVSTKRDSQVAETLEEACSLLDGLRMRDSSEELNKNKLLSSAISEDLCEFISESSPNLSAETTPHQKLDNHIPRSEKKCRSSMFQHLSPVGEGKGPSECKVEYFYYDQEADAGLIEQSLPSVSNSFKISPNDSADLQTSTANSSGRLSDETILYDWKSFISEDSDKEGDVIPSQLHKLNNSQIMERLRSLGEEPGPITETTRRVYLILLTKIMNDPDRGRTKSVPQCSFKHELAQVLTGIKPLEDFSILEAEMVSQFDLPDPKRKWREGNLKSSFNYLLLDPRVSLNLPMRHTRLPFLEVFKIFVSAIFYVGKGKRSRPYQHFYEALDEVKKEKKTKNKKPSNKVRHIKEIWAAGLGVISLHIFQNVIPVEAYTREACMVEALTLQRLTNIKRGDYYGVASTWDARRKRKLGIHLLQKACHIFLIEGERMIRPADIKIGQ
ncbi:Ankyrin repeat and LEM domain-containing protein 1 [Holothuria leucospilota]|uniref:Ankyrin repeat and LEM domain-containing protein 1 n=1 Tax=Holothuria leucospilota TaxID=206669 RepID=A0A9Q1BMW0_HOLLE|nr:Ankyrin repeat and LEM domain-containing protein 1 [Holothuria leucospilota]